MTCSSPLASRRKSNEIWPVHCNRDTSASTRQELWLEWAACAGLAPEDRLSRLTAWTLAAHRAGADYGLRLPGVELPPADGDAHKRRSLEALALW